MNLTVLGAGAWGTALAVHACAAQPTLLWARDPAQAAAMRATRRNARYLPEVALPAALEVESDLSVALAHSAGGLVFIATPMAGLAAMLSSL
ncbi:MAG TPA: glycerol-3-phosphate dehydrogenase, partial [Caldimonas sp.]|nr:glycerol-3-phosphate dehydrogenase [Caldimonas sp.]